MKITTDPNRNVVVIDGLDVPGFIDERRSPTCGNARLTRCPGALTCAPRRRSCSVRMAPKSLARRI
jgi:hypothetical protein